VTTSDEQFLSLEDVAARLQVSDQTVRRWIKSGKLTAYKPGLEYRVRETDLEEFLRAREVRPKAPRRSPFEPSLLNGLEEERRYAETGLATESWPYVALDSLVQIIRDLIEDYAPIIGGLPEKPSAEEYRRRGSLLVTFLKRTASINKALIESGVGVAHNELWAAMKEGKPVPQDLGRKIREFHSLVETLNAELEPPAREWLQRLSEKAQLHSGLDETAERWRQELKEAERKPESSRKPVSSE
jgi:excisionase family DNA binding protein